MFDASLRLFRRRIYNPATGNMTTCESYREGRLKEKQVYEETQASDGTIKLKMVRHERF